MSGFHDFCIRTCDQYARQAGLPLYSDLLAKHKAEMAAAATEAIEVLRLAALDITPLSRRITSLPDFTRGNEHDFPEDFGHENGTYFQECQFCNHSFVGHKRRVTCKLCVMAVTA